MVMGLIKGFSNVKGYGFLIYIRTCVLCLILSLIVPSLSGCGGGGNAPPGGNDMEGVAGIVLVELVAAETGVNFETVETDDFIATVYIGEQIYDDSDSEEDSFAINFGVGIAPLMSYLNEMEEFDEE